MTLLDRILTRVGRLRPGRMLATAALFPFYLVGLIAGGILFVVMLIGSAIVEGFQDGKRSR